MAFFSTAVWSVIGVCLIQAPEEQNPARFRLTVFLSRKGFEHDTERYPPDIRMIEHAFRVAMKRQEPPDWSYPLNADSSFSSPRAFTDMARSMVRPKGSSAAPELGEVAVRSNSK